MHANEVLTGMAAQRRALGLAPSWEVDLPERPVVVPVVAVQRGASAESIRRMMAVRDALQVSALGAPALEIYEVSLLGELIPLDESRLASGRPRAVARSYAVQNNNRGIAWKQHSATLPEEARVEEGPPYVLPEVVRGRQPAPGSPGGVAGTVQGAWHPWHQGSGGNPSRQLRSSQVQCVNALGQMIGTRTRIKRAFGGVLDIDRDARLRGHRSNRSRSIPDLRVRGAGGLPARGASGKRTRGAQGDERWTPPSPIGRALAWTSSLVEWKFTEDYPSADRDAERSQGEDFVVTRSQHLRPKTARSTAEGIELAGSLPRADLPARPAAAIGLAPREDPGGPGRRRRVVHVLSPENAATSGPTSLPPALTLR